MRYGSKDAARQQWYQMVEGGKAVRVMVCRHKNRNMKTICGF